jgi:hypothetical protein
MIDDDFEIKELQRESPPEALVEGWLAFDEGWSSFSNPYPNDDANSDLHWLWSVGWQEAEGAMIADRELAAGADPEDYK